MKRVGVLVAAAIVLAGCGASDSVNASAKVRCPAKALAGWQRLANRIDAPVFCPSWLPDPLDGVIGSQWNNIDEVSWDRSYLLSWVWQETGLGAAGGEKHVNLRGYPGRTRVPRCVDADSKQRKLIPCFSDNAGKVRAGGLYTVSEHVAPPFGYRKVRQNLDRMLRGLVPIKPTAS